MAANPGVYTGMELRVIVASGTRPSFPFGQISQLHRGGAFPRGLRFQLLPLFLLPVPKRLIFLLHLLLASSTASRASCRLRGPTWLPPLKGTRLQRTARWRLAGAGAVAASAWRDSSVLAPEGNAAPDMRVPPRRTRRAGVPHAPLPHAAATALGCVPESFPVLGVLYKCSHPKRDLSGWQLLSLSAFSAFIHAVAWLRTPLLPAAEADSVIEAGVLRRLMAVGTVSTVQVLYVI